MRGASGPVRPRRRGLAAAGALAAAAAAARYWYDQPEGVCPYSQRLWVQLPHPLVTRARVHRLLAPSRGERVLEVGPGTGHYSTDLARALAPGGTLELLDVQVEMLDHALRGARRRGLTNLLATQGDAQELPFPDGRFDAATLLFTLGEIPDRRAALRELRRVLRPGGRLVVGDLLGSPRWVRLGRLRAWADDAGLALERAHRWPVGYVARFRAS